MNPSTIVGFESTASRSANAGICAIIAAFTDTDSGQTINMNNGVQNEPQNVELFITNPIAIAFESSRKEGWVVSAATNRIIQVELDANGTPTINPPKFVLVLVKPKIRS